MKGYSNTWLLPDQSLGSIIIWTSVSVNEEGSLDRTRVHGSQRQQSESCTRNTLHISLLQTQRWKLGHYNILPSVDIRRMLQIPSLSL